MAKIETKKFALNKILSISLSIMIVSCALTGCGKKLEYTDEKCFDFYNGEISKYYCYLGNTDGYDEITDVVIPEKIKGVKVTKIGEGAFSDSWGKKYIHSVILPSTLTEIGEKAFYNNSIKELVIPKNVVTIGPYAFSKNEIRELEIPSSVRTIKYLAFSNNKINKLVFKNGVETIESGAFIDNDDLKEVKLPDSLISFNYNYDDYYESTSNVFDNTLTKITLGKNLKNIYVGVFGNIKPINGENRQEALSSDFKIYMTSKQQKAFDWDKIFTQSYWYNENGDKLVPTVHKCIDPNAYETDVEPNYFECKYDSIDKYIVIVD